MTSPERRPVIENIDVVSATNAGLSANNATFPLLQGSYPSSHGFLLEIAQAGDALMDVVNVADICLLQDFGDMMLILPCSLEQRF